MFLFQTFIRQSVKAGGHRGALQEEAGGHGTPQETGTQTHQTLDSFLLLNVDHTGVSTFQNKLMEEKNTVLVQTNVGLEEELRKANAAKGQLETYKRQVPERQPTACSRSWLRID